VPDHKKIGIFEFAAKLSEGGRHVSVAWFRDVKCAGLSQLAGGDAAANRRVGFTWATCRRW
jgi:hypothetical protein